MPVPPKRHSKGKTRRRRSHHALSAVTTSRCPQCNAIVQPHRACPSCGAYRGRDVLKKAVRAERAVAAKKAKPAKKVAKKTSKKKAEKAE